MFYLIDKPLNLTSFDVIRKLRKILNIKKIGHTGTLDPLATWCLVIATWNSTKLIRYLEKDSKTYSATICLNAFSKTWDKEWELYFIDKTSLEKLKKINISKIKNIIKNDFIWKIKQIPSKYSAIKINWKSAYKYMREWNEDIKIPEREVEIYKFLKIDFYKKDELYFLDIKVKVSAWTYIRTLAEDIWKALWVWWYLTKLKRISIWNLNIKDSVTLEQLEKAKNNLIFYEECSVKLWTMFPDFWIMSIKSELMKKILQWKKILKTEFINISEYSWKYLFVKYGKTVCLLEREWEWRYFKVARNNVA